MQVSGDMRMGETANASWAISRVYGFGLWGMLACMVAMTIVMLGLGEFVRAVAPAIAEAFWLPMVVVSAVMTVVVVTRVRRWRVSRALKARGMSTITPVTFTLDERAFAMDSPEAVTRLGWPAITDMLQTKTHWVFVTQGMGYCLPRRFFASAADERAFVREALAHMTEAARGRSGKATAFVAWE